MSNKNIICVRCGKIQPKLNLFIDIDNKYVIFNQPVFCSRCQANTEQIATGEIEDLRNKLEANPNDPLDSYVLKLVKR